MECEEFILPDWSQWRTGHLPEWSSPDDPAMVFAAVGRLNPIHYFFFKRNGHLPDWSSPDDPARFLAAVGRLKPSYYKTLPQNIKKQLEESNIQKLGRGQRQKYINRKYIHRIFK